MTLDDLLIAVAIGVVVFSTAFTIAVLLRLFCEKLINWACGMEK